jgi:hypothetical protein
MGGYMTNSGCMVAFHHTVQVSPSSRIREPRTSYLGLLDSATITGFENMLSFNPENALIGLVLAHSNVVTML